MNGMVRHGVKAAIDDCFDSITDVTVTPGRFQQAQARARGTCDDTLNGGVGLPEEINNRHCVRMYHRDLW